jgi:hypothetical protein
MVSRHRTGALAGRTGSRAPGAGGSRRVSSIGSRPGGTRRRARDGHRRRAGYRMRNCGGGYPPGLSRGRAGPPAPHRPPLAPPTPQDPSRRRVPRRRHPPRPAPSSPSRHRSGHRNGAICACGHRTFCRSSYRHSSFRRDRSGRRGCPFAGRRMTGPARPGAAVPRPGPGASRAVRGRAGGHRDGAHRRAGQASRAPPGPRTRRRPGGVPGAGDPLRKRHERAPARDRRRAGALVAAVSGPGYGPSHDLHVSEGKEGGLS